MRPAAVVVADELAKDSSQMTFAERDEPIQAFPADSANQSLAKGVRLGALRGVLKTRIPKLRTAQSQSVEKMESRSWIKNRYG